MSIDETRVKEVIKYITDLLCKVTKERCQLTPIPPKRSEEENMLLFVWGLLDKQIARKPNHHKVIYGEHKWATDTNGEIDEWSWESGFHNGVTCTNCGEQVCVLCNPDYDTIESECSTYETTCPLCLEKLDVHSKQPYCSCGQRLDWSDFDIKKF